MKRFVCWCTIWFQHKAEISFLMSQVSCKPKVWRAESVESTTKLSSVLWFKCCLQRQHCDSLSRSVLELRSFLKLPFIMCSAFWHQVELQTLSALKGFSLLIGRGSPSSATTLLLPSLFSSLLWVPGVSSLKPEWFQKLLKNYGNNWLFIICYRL